MPRKKTHEEFLEEVSLKGDGDFTVIDKYNGTMNKINIKHNTCGEIFLIRPMNFLAGNGCPYCSQTGKWTHSYFVEKVKEVVGEEYSVVGKCTGAKKKVLMRHNVCKLEWMVEAHSFVNVRSCPKCAGKLKKTTKIFKNEVFELVNEEYTVVGEYEGANNKIKMKHEKCGYEYMVRPSDFLNNNRRCGNCSKYKKKTHEEFIESLNHLNLNEYNFITEYKNSGEKIELEHLLCGDVWSVNPSVLKRGGTCPTCNGSKRLTDKEYRNRVFKLVGNEYTVLGNFEKVSKKIKMRHNSSNCDNYEWDVLPSGFLNGNRCRKCAGNIPISEKEFISRMGKLTGKDYTLVGEYINRNEKVLIRHNNEECNNYEYEVAPSVFLSGCRCPRCSGKEKITLDILKERLFDLYSDTLVLGDEVITNSKQKVQLTHINKECNNYTWYAQPSYVLNGNGCPYCNKKGMTKGEKKIHDFLSSKYFSFLPQYTYDDCKNKKPLPFDFVIFNPDKSVNCLIEYDGEQHYQNKEFFGGEEGFKQRQYNDQIKNQYCKDNNIKLIRIPYWDFDNIEDILNEELKEVINQNKLESNV